MVSATDMGHKTCAQAAPVTVKESIHRTYRVFRHSNAQCHLVRPVEGTQDGTESREQEVMLAMCISLPSSSVPKFLLLNLALRPTYLHLQRVSAGHA